MMTRWHPATKLLILLAVLAIPYLLWTTSDGTPAVAQATRAADAGAEPALAELTAEEAAQRRALPPLQTFAAVVERPLFTPTRRLVRPVELPPPAEPEPEAEPEEIEIELEPALVPPELRFFGTVRQRGRMTALVTREGEPGMEQLSPGDTVEGWEVTSVTRDQLVLVHEGEEMVYSIFKTLEE